MVIILYLVNMIFGHALSCAGGATKGVQKRLGPRLEIIRSAKIINDLTQDNHVLL
jgi:hypothetical protein